MKPRLLCCIFPAILLTGCFGVVGPKTVPVAGKITFGGKPPPGPVLLTFAPLDSGSGDVRPPGMAIPLADGSFSATTARPGDGLVPGRYRIDIECWQQPPTMEQRGISYVPPGFKPAELTIDASAAKVTCDLDVPAAN